MTETQSSRSELLYLGGSIEEVCRQSCEEDDLPYLGCEGSGIESERVASL